MKQKTRFFNLLFRKTALILIYELLISLAVQAQLPTAQQIAVRMKIGCNLGNTLEAIGGESAWGAAKTTQRLIDSVKAAGFNSIRLPCSWFSHSDTLTNQINIAWIARVKEVVNYCINDSLYTILNIHWDKGWPRSAPCHLHGAPVFLPALTFPLQSLPVLAALPGGR